MINRHISMTFDGRCPPDYNPVLMEIAAVVEEHAQLQGWNQDLAFRINLALEEVAINIVSYGGERGGPSPNIEIRLTPGGGNMTIQVSDDGKPFNPLKDAPPPSLIDENTKAAPVGGFGLHLIKNMMDSVTYQHWEGKNHLTMTARIEQG